MLNAFFLWLAPGTASASYLLSLEGISPDHSAEYTRSMSRNASMKADAVFYNPAGLALMQDGGIFIMANLQNTYRSKTCSNGLWGYETADLFNNLTAPMVRPFFFQNRNSGSSVSSVPNDLYFVYRHMNWAVFAGASILQGRPGTSEYAGVPTLDRIMLLFNSVLASRLSQQLVSADSYGYFRRREMHTGVTAGVSYAFLDGLSGSLSLRYINVSSNTRVVQVPYGVRFSNNIDASQYQCPTLIDTSVFGSGFGVIAGIDYQPTKDITIAARAEYYPPMVLVKRTNRFIANPVLAQSGMLNEFCDGIWPLVLNDRLASTGMGNILNTLFMDPRTTRNIGNRVKATYPPSLSLGFSWGGIRNLRLDTSADLTFPRARDLDGRERDWNVLGYRVAQGIEWNVRPWAALSAGYSYHDPGIRSSKRNETDDLLSSHTMGAGCSFKATKFLDVTLSGSYSIYAPYRGKATDIFTSTMLGDRFAIGEIWNRKLTRDRWGISIGMTFAIYPVSGDRQKNAEDHYWKGMSHYLAGDIDTAIGEFREARRNNMYYKDVNKKISELTRLMKLKKRNDQDEKKDKGELEDEKKEGPKGYEQ